MFPSSFILKNKIVPKDKLSHYFLSGLGKADCFHINKGYFLGPVKTQQIKPIFFPPDHTICRYKSSLVADLFKYLHYPK